MKKVDIYILKFYYFNIIITIYIIYNIHFYIIFNLYYEFMKIKIINNIISKIQNANIITFYISIKKIYINKAKKYLLLILIIYKYNFTYSNYKKN